MKLKHLLFGFLGIIIIYIQSCAPAYIPTKVNSPLLTKAGEVSFDMAVGSNGLEPQLAISVVDHIAIMANGCFSLSGINEDEENYHNHVFGEGGVGFYTVVDDNVVVELYGGLGYGKTNSLWHDRWPMSDSAQIKSTYYRYFIQPAVGLVNDYFDVGFTSRFSINQMNLDPNVIQTIEVNDVEYFWEPAFTIRTGGKLKFAIQIGASIPLVQEPGSSRRNRMFFCSLGTHVRFGLWKKKIRDSYEMEN